VLASHKGYVPWQTVLADSRPEQAARLRRLSWFWTNPILSILLAPEGRVATIVGPVNERRWQPFDPKDLDALPEAPQFDYTAYAAALNRR